MKTALDREETEQIAVLIQVSEVSEDIHKKHKADLMNLRRI